MLKRIVAVILGAVLFAGTAVAQTCPPFLYNFTNGTTANADQVMNNFNVVRTCANTLASGGTFASPTFSGSTTVSAGSFLGIGTSSPALAGVPLEIKAGGSYLALNSTTGGYTTIFGLDNGAERWALGQAAFGGQDGLAFYSGSSQTERARIDGNGDLLVGTPTGSSHILYKSATLGSQVLAVGSTTTLTNSAIFNSVNGQGWNTANAAIFVGRDNSTLRSINATGTVNAAGNDYAEYEQLATGLSASTLHGGQIIGFAADGKVTVSCKDAISFGVVSSNPSYIGGDGWGAEASIGKFPVKPVRPQTASTKSGSPEAKPVPFDQSTGFNSKDADIVQFYLDAAAWTDKFKAAEQHVAIIAYAGKVPVNVTGAHAGDYIVPTCSGDASITGTAVASSTVSFEQFRKTVGQVRSVLPDGRAQIAVGR